jgi:hypothetical protein
MKFVVVFPDSIGTPTSARSKRLCTFADASINPAFPSQNSYQPDRVFKLKRRSNYAGEPVTSISYWRGIYIRYGRAKDGTLLFCSQPCGWHFGVACWHAGMRIPKDK